MSPIPPNKDINPPNDRKRNSNDLNPNETDLNTATTVEQADLNPDESQPQTYEPLEQNPNAIPTSQGPDHPDEDDDDDDDDEDDSDSEPDELDPDEHFAMFASSRAFAKKSEIEPGPDYAKYAHSFDCDVFERKRTLESEEIHLDENRSQQINNLMQNFKLPEEAIPAWAKLVPEDVWKKNLLDCLSAKKLDLFDEKQKSQTTSSN